MLALLLDRWAYELMRLSFRLRRLRRLRLRHGLTVVAARPRPQQTDGTLRRTRYPHLQVVATTPMATAAAHLHTAD